MVLGPVRDRQRRNQRALTREIPGPGPAYVFSDGVLAVLSLPAISAWSNGRVLWWRTAAGEMVWPAVDTPAAARRLAELLTSAHPPG